MSHRGKAIDDCEEIKVKSPSLIWMKKIGAITGDVAQSCFLFVVLDRYTFVHCNIIQYGAC